MAPDLIICTDALKDSQKGVNSQKLNQVYMDERCNQTETSHGGQVLSQKDEYYQNDMDCWLILESRTAYASQRIDINFEWVNLEDYNDTCIDYLEIYDGTVDDDMPNKDPMDTICGNQTSPFSGPISREMSVTLRLYTNSENVGRGFDLIFTSYHTDTCLGDDVFFCENRRCIDISLECDGFNNCGDNSDELNCDQPSSKLL
ncbi:enteropeptidase-like [Glandiceps talaboti]